LGTWNIKIKVKEIGIKFHKEAEKFQEIDIRLLNILKNILHIETQGATGMNATNMFLP
jgi:predicted transposase YbfD/YdcC